MRDKFTVEGDNFNKKILFNGNELSLDIVFESNGEYYAYFKDGGGLSPWVLRIIADIIDELNKPFQEDYLRYLNLKENLTELNDDLPW